MADDPNPRKSGDITKLSELAPSEDRHFGTSVGAEPSAAIEGMDDFLNPMAPTSPGVGDGGSSAFTFSADPNAPTGEADPLLDPIASLPPVDGDTLAAAAGADALPGIAPDAEDPARASPALEGTAVGQAIAGALSATSAPTPMDDVRNYSDRLAPSASPEVAETPYSLVIEGPLRPHEREALLGILSRENLGVREIELEPQFAAGHVLIPRISEYAGVLIVQTLRNATAKMRLGPSERIFVSPQAEDGDRLIVPPAPDAEVFIHEEGGGRAEAVLLTSADAIPGKKLLAAIDTLHTSMNLKSVALSQPQSPLFQDAIERLKVQLKSQARHRGANALVGFKYALHPLEGQAFYKLVVEARAVRVEP